MVEVRLDVSGNPAEDRSPVFVELASIPQKGEFIRVDDGEFVYIVESVTHLAKEAQNRQGGVAAVLTARKIRF